MLSSFRIIELDPVGSLQLSPSGWKLEPSIFRLVIADVYPAINEDLRADAIEAKYILSVGIN
jgi:hypothetical protein